MTKLDVAKIAGIKFKNRDAVECNFDFFIKSNKDKKESIVNLCVVYGGNGSGKTTLSRIFDPGGEIFGSSYIEYYDINRKALCNDQVKIDNVFVFNEDYVRKNVVVTGEGVNSIVLIGTDVKFSQDVDKLENELESASKRVSEIKDTISKNKQALDNTSRQIEKILKGEGGWAQRESEIVGNKNKSAVKQEWLQNLIKKAADGGCKKSDLGLFRQQLEEYRQLVGGERISEQLPEIIDPYPVEQVVEMLSKVYSLNSPIDNDRGHRRMAQQKGKGKNDLISLKQLLSNSKDYCPTCLRDFDGHYLESLIDDVNELIRTFEAAPETHEIKRLIKDVELPDIDVFKDILSTEEYDNLVALREKLLKYNKHINELIRKKLDAPAESIPDLEDVRSTWFSVLKEINIAHSSVNDKINLWNSNLQQRDEFRERLKRINFELACDEIYEHSAQYKSIDDSIRGDEHRLEQFRQKIEEINAEISKIKAQMRQTKEAADKINSMLYQIFGGRRLRLEVDKNDGTSYITYSRETRVSPSMLSTGERNILGLCYFFVSVANNQNYDAFQARPNLVVLDDPVSSFDFEHKYSIMTFISNQVRSFLKGSKKSSKFLVLTHDVSVAREMDNLFVGLSDLSGRNSFFLEGAKIISRNLSKHDYYQRYLEESYGFAFKVDGNQGISSRNNVRRLFEAYLTFVHSTNVTDWINNKVVSNALNAKDCSIFKYYEARPIRCYVHQDSHGEEHMYDGNWGLLESISQEDFRIFVRDLLVLMYILTPTHILSRCQKFSDRSEVEQRFEDSIKDIIKKASNM